ncbi:ion channel [Methylomonas sp. AM2-LC]|uniref:ion channel n=1 Tax=Methylomonas sp. AM2-LC TaxID=3153301 RepID=UPI0032638B47
MKHQFRHITNLRRASKLAPRQIINQDGRFQVSRLNWHSFWRDPYHLMLTIPWSGFLLLISVGYLTLNLLFACAYWLGGDCIANALPDSLLDKFFFSVQTLASIGYGVMYPKTLYANAMVTLESIVGLTGIAVMTGLSFARFSRPTARILFSKVAVITQHNQVETLIFRAANKRTNQILEAQMHCYLFRDEVTLEGKSMRRIYDLKLVRSQTPNFMLTWSVMHEVDELSPIYGMTHEDFKRTNTTITIILSGIDETVSQMIHARHVYSPQDILINKQFVDIIYHSDDGNRYIDYSLFHDVE